jgi:hypothetical protein
LLLVVHLDISQFGQSGGVARGGNVAPATGPVDVWIDQPLLDEVEENGGVRTDVSASLEFRVFLAWEYTEGVRTEVITLLKNS